MEAVPSQPPAEKHCLEFDVCLTSTSVATRESVGAALQTEFRAHSVWELGKFDMGKLKNDYLREHVAEITVSTPDETVPAAAALLFWQIEPRFNIYQLSEELAAEDDEGEDSVPSFRDWLLPCREFHGMWEALCFDSDVKGRLLSYAASALLFAQLGVDAQMINWNRVVLLHGPPGTGKTSLCKALAQKLAVRLQRYPMAQLVEVSAHSLFSKWFSESGKLVSKLFAKITEMVEDPDNLVFVLIDEVESLTAARKAAVSGSEPSDAIRAVNALLTQLDALKSRPNVMVLCTSNLCAAIDVAFIDRADIKVFIGPPPLSARYQILWSCVQELRRVGFLEGKEGDFPPAWSASLLGNSPDSGLSQGGTRMSIEGGLGSQHLLLEVAEACDGFSGRALRKLPFQAHARHGLGMRATCPRFLEALRSTVEAESADQESLVSG
eukprot:jgi/Tetstr1/427271/TSEL_001724.t1